MFVCLKILIPEFQLSFNEGATSSTQERALFQGPIPALHTFTSCLWFSVKFFSASYNVLWQYCTVDRPGGQMKCSELGEAVT